MFAMILPFLWKNKKLIAEIIGIILLAILCWWFFIHNPKVIKALENDKAEQARIIKAKDAEINLYKNIEKGRVVINEAIQSQISTLRSESRPKRTIIIRAGRMLSPVPTSQSTH